MERNWLGVIVVLAAGCGQSPGAQVTNGSTVEALAGQQFEVALASAGDGGYSNWVLETGPDERVAVSVSSRHEEPTSGLAGDFGRDVFAFRAQGPGRTAVAFSATRSFSGEQLRAVVSFVVK